MVKSLLLAWNSIWLFCWMSSVSRTGERLRLSHHQHASTVQLQGKSKHSSCLTFQAAGNNPPPRTIGMALLTLAQGRSSSARVIFSPSPLEVNKRARYQGTRQENSRTAAQGTWPAYQIHRRRGQHHLCAAL